MFYCTSNLIAKNKIKPQLNQDITANRTSIVPPPFQQHYVNLAICICLFWQQNGTFRCPVHIKWAHIHFFLTKQHDSSVSSVRCTIETFVSCRLSGSIVLVSNALLKFDASNFFILTPISCLTVPTTHSLVLNVNRSVWILIWSRCGTYHYT